MSNRPTPDDPPPLLGSWRNIYIVLAAALVVETIAFWLLGRWA